MSSSTRHGHASSSQQPRDPTFHLSLNWEEYPITPIEPRDSHAVIPHPHRAVPDHVGLIPVPQERPTSVGQVEPAHHDAHFATLSEIGLAHFETIEEERPDEYVVDAGLVGDLALFSYLRRFLRARGISPSTAAIFQNLEVDIDLLAGYECDPGYASLIRRMSHEKAGNNVIKLEVGTQLRMKPGILEIIDTLSQLYHLLELRQRRTLPRHIDEELVIQQFLRLYFVHVFDSLPLLHSLRTSWDLSEWQKLSLSLRDFQEYQQAIKCIESLPAQVALAEAEGAEGWIRKRMKNSLHSKGEHVDPAMFPTREIAARILGVISNFHNLVRTTWRDVGDPRGRTMVEWIPPPVPDVQHPHLGAPLLQDHARDHRPPPIRQRSSPPPPPPPPPTMYAVGSDPFGTPTQLPASDEFKPRKRGIRDIARRLVGRPPKQDKGKGRDQGGGGDRRIIE